MEDNIFAVALEAIAAVGSKDPFAAADYLGILPVDISGSILGYAALYNDKYPAIGLNTKLDPVWRMFGGWHEIGHVLFGDVFDKALRKLEERKNDLESEMGAMNCCKSFFEMASELNTTETVLRYKLEAMRLHGEDIDRQELERYDQVFKGAL